MKMKPIHNAVLHSVLAVIFFILGLARESQLFLFGAILLAAAGSYWVWKTWQIQGR